MEAERLRRWMVRGFGALIVLFVLGGTAFMLAPPADIRPDAALSSPDPSQVAHGRQLLQRLVQRYGGLSRWRAARATRVVLRDHWPAGPLKMLASPWREGESLDLTYLNGRDMSRLQFIGGERDGQRWGIQHWRTYTEAANGARQFEDDRDIAFWLPTIQYFFELPFRMSEAGVVQHAGTRTLDGVTYDLVYATWERHEPQTDIDQYLLWINRDSGLLDYSQYTVREMGKLITGNMRYEDVREVDGLRFPFRMTAGGKPSEPEVLHRFEVYKIETLPQLAESSIIVDPARRGHK